MQAFNKGNGSNGSRPSKKARKNSEEFEHVLKLNMCSRHGDLHGALEVYDIAKQGVFNLKQQHYNMLLYICSAAASGSLTLRKGAKIDRTPVSKQKNEEEINEEDNDDGEVINFSPCDMNLAAEKGVEIYEDMMRKDVPPNEATFTSIARLAVANGNGDMAFETVKKMASANIAPKLRSYGPPLLCFCKNNQVEKAFEVDDHMIASGVLPDENLLQALLRLSIEAGLEERVYSILHRLRITVRDLLPTTVATIEMWFNSKPSISAGEKDQPSEEDIETAITAGGGGWHGLGWLGTGKWKTKRTTISKTGFCSCCGEKLCQSFSGLI
jgi:proteinaceous RNase P